MSADPEIDDFGTSERSKQRAYVIERSINIEWIINSIISQHYFGRVVQAFVFEVLYDEQFSFGLRRRILEKISQLSPAMVNNLGRLNTIRNYFAHCNQSYVDARTGGAMVPNPRRPSDAIDFDTLFAEFKTLASGIEIYLVSQYTQRGGVLIERPGAGDRSQGES